MLRVHGAASHPPAGTLRPRPLLQRMCGGERVQVLRPLPHLPRVLQASVGRQAAGGREGGRVRALGRGRICALWCLRANTLSHSCSCPPSSLPPFVPRVLCGPPTHAVPSRSWRSRRGQSPCPWNRHGAAPRRHSPTLQGQSQANDSPPITTDLEITILHQ
jgi:hypothetical protein